MVSDDWFSEGESTSVRAPVVLAQPSAGQRSGVATWYGALLASITPSRFGRLVIAWAFLGSLSIVCLIFDPGSGAVIYIWAYPVALAFLLVSCCWRFSLLERCFLLSLGGLSTAAIWIAAGRAVNEYDHINVDLYWGTTGHLYLHTLITFGAIICFWLGRGFRFRVVERVLAYMTEGNRLNWSSLSVVLVGMVFINMRINGAIEEWGPLPESVQVVLRVFAFLLFFVLPIGAGFRVQHSVQLLVLWLPCLVGIVMMRLVFGGAVVLYGLVELLLIYAAVFIFLLWPLFQSPQATSPFPKGVIFIWWQRLASGVWASTVAIGLAAMVFAYAFDVAFLFSRPRQSYLPNWKSSDFRQAYFMQRSKHKINFSSGGQVISMRLPPEAGVDYVSRLPLHELNFNFASLNDMRSHVDLSSMAGLNSAYNVAGSQLTPKQIATLLNGSTRLYLLDVDIIEDGQPPLENIYFSSFHLFAKRPGDVERCLSMAKNWNPDAGQVKFLNGAISISSDDLSAGDWESMMRLARNQRIIVSLSGNPMSRVELTIPEDLIGTPADRMSLTIGDKMDVKNLRSLVRLVNGSHIRLNMYTHGPTEIDAQRNPEIAIEKFLITYDVIWSTWGGFDWTDAYLIRPLKFWREPIWSQDKLQQLYLFYGPPDAPKNSLYVPDIRYLNHIDPIELPGLKRLSIEPAWLINPERSRNQSYNWVNFFDSDESVSWPQAWGEQTFPELEELHVSLHHSIKDFSFLSTMPNLRLLKLRTDGLRPNELGVLAATLPKLTKLETIIWEGKVDSDVVAVVAKLPSMKQIVLSEIYGSELDVFRRYEKIPAQIALSSRLDHEVSSVIPSQFLEHRRRVMQLIRERYQQPLRADQK